LPSKSGSITSRSKSLSVRASSLALSHLPPETRKPAPQAGFAICATGFEPVTLGFVARANGPAGLRGHGSSYFAESNYAGVGWDPSGILPHFLPRRPGSDTSSRVARMHRIDLDTTFGSNPLRGSWSMPYPAALEI
jgi:hypothetical protein